jgi:gamma-glutamyltranspeptidase/glutathione hydrolase
MGHKLEEGSRLWGNMQVITWDYAGGTVQAAADPRGEGEGLIY